MSDSYRIFYLYKISGCWVHHLNPLVAQTRRQSYASPCDHPPWRHPELQLKAERFFWDVWMIFGSYFKRGWIVESLSRMRSKGSRFAFMFATVCATAVRLSHAQMLPEWARKCVTLTCDAAVIMAFAEEVHEVACSWRDTPLEVACATWSGMRHLKCMKWHEVACSRCDTPLEVATWSGIRHSKWHAIWSGLRHSEREGYTVSTSLEVARHLKWHTPPEVAYATRSGTPLQVARHLKWHEVAWSGKIKIHHICSFFVFFWKFFWLLCNLLLNTRILSKRRILDSLFFGGRTRGPLRMTRETPDLRRVRTCNTWGTLN